MATARLKEITAGKLNLEFFNKIIRRIEATKPLAGGLISASDEPDGVRISLDADFQELNVCSNGEPATIKILVKKA